MQRKAYGVSDPTRLKYPSKVFTLTIHNRDMLRLAWIRYPTILSAFHIETKEDYQVHFEIDGEVRTIRFVDSGGKVFKRYQFAGDLEPEYVMMIMTMTLRKLKIRLEKDALGVHESKTVIYYL